MVHQYKQLNIDEREIIQQGLWEGRLFRKIVSELSRSLETISWELERNDLKGWRYVPRAA